jgi:transcriptional regulator with XRE-family HTH domain
MYTWEMSDSIPIGRTRSGARRKAADVTAPPGTDGVQVAGADWRKRLRSARRTLGLSQDALAKLAGLSQETIRGYESGRRRPRREHLADVLSALRLEHVERRRIIEDAGFAPDPRVDADLMARISHTIESAAAECERHDWPAFVTNEFADVVGANTVVQRLWGIEMPGPGSGMVERNLLSVASDPHFADHLINWEEAFGTILSVFKAHDWAPEDIDQPGPYLAAVLERFLAGDARYVRRLIEIWQAAPVAWERKEHWSYPIVWRGPGNATMHFAGIVTSASLVDGLTINDWIPLDGRTWRALRNLAAGELTTAEGPPTV